MTHFRFKTPQFRTEMICFHTKNTLHQIILPHFRTEMVCFRTEMVCFRTEMICFRTKSTPHQIILHHFHTGMVCFRTKTIPRQIISLLFHYHIIVLSH
jgi:hypothetical protein